MSAPSPAGGLKAYPRVLAILSKRNQILGRIHSHEVHEARAGYQEAKTELQRSRPRKDLRKSVAIAHAGYLSSELDLVKISSRPRRISGMRKPPFRKRGAKWRKSVLI